MGFRRSPGIHLIVVGSHALFSAADFDALAVATAKQLHQAVADENGPKPGISQDLQPTRVP